MIKYITNGYIAIATKETRFKRFVKQARMIQEIVKRKFDAEYEDANTEPTGGGGSRHRAFSV